MDTEQDTKTNKLDIVLTYNTYFIPLQVLATFFPNRGPRLVFMHHLAFLGMSGTDVILG